MTTLALYLKNLKSSLYIISFMSPKCFSCIVFTMNNPPPRFATFGAEILREICHKICEMKTTFIYLPLNLKHLKTIPPTHSRKRGMKPAISDSMQINLHSNRRCVIICLWQMKCRRLTEPASVSWIYCCCHFKSASNGVPVPSCPVILLINYTLSRPAQLLLHHHRPELSCVSVFI